MTRRAGDHRGVGRSVFRGLQLGELTELTNRIANALLVRGVQRGDVVMIINPQSLQTAAAFLAIWRMSAVALPIAHRFGP